ncbi:hypothetical protein ACFVZC_16820 [Streptomyces marokkonensis]|uniref:Uncharacterized protein n=1 Tax=Streptomyces marokkonensis TaxID=324855 RepID=A0ABW6Q785_9ACTN
MALEEADYVLVQLVELANRSGLEFGVTVASNGQTITGTLISNQKWFEAQAEFVRTASGASSDEVGLHTVFESWRDVNREASAEDTKVHEALKDIELPERFQKAIDEAEQRAGYIHLSGARYVSSQGFMPAEGVLWRGRLDAVTGWSVGEMRTGGE